MSTTARQIVAGQLSDVDLPTLLHTFSVCRQVIALEILSPTGQVTGRVVLKSGKVVAATAGFVTGTLALRKLMSSGAQARFRVFNEGADLTGNVVPLGSVNELVEYPGASSSEPRPRVRMMEGSVAEFDIPTVMQAACLGRQYTELDVLGANRMLIGTISIKSGKVVSARAGTIEGMAAIHHLLDTPKSFEFAVYRTSADHRAELRDEEPLGSVGEILIRAQRGKSPAQANRQATASRSVMSAAPARAHGQTLMMGDHFVGEEAPTAQRAAQSDRSRVRVMEGSLSDFDIPSLLQVVNLGRQQVLLEVLDGERLIGAVAVKGGMVLRAAAGRLEGTAAVQKLIDSPSTFKFVMWRIPANVDDVEPIGSLESTLLRAAAASGFAAEANRRLAQAPSVLSPPPVAAASSPRIAVMEGSFSEFDLESLLAAVGLMRQHTELEVWEHDVLLGTVHLRSGMVLRSTAGDLNGVAALKRLMAASNKWRFAVFRSPAERDEVEPIGPLNEVLRRALVRTDAPTTPARPSAAPVDSAAPRRRSSRWVILAAAAALGVTAFVFFRARDADHGSSAGVVSMHPASVVTASPPIAAGAPPDTAHPATATPAAPAPLAQATPAPLAPAPVRAPPGPAESRPSTVEQPPLPPARKSYVPEVAAAQATLKKLGYDPGPIDGIAGPRTAAAVRAFQRAEHLNVDGVANAETRAALESGPAVAR